MDNQEKVVKTTFNLFAAELQVPEFQGLSPQQLEDPGLLTYRTILQLQGIYGKKVGPDDLLISNEETKGDFVLTFHTDGTGVVALVRDLSTTHELNAVLTLDTFVSVSEKDFKITGLFHGDRGIIERQKADYQDPLFDGTRHTFVKIELGLGKLADDLERFQTRVFNYGYMISSEFGRLVKVKDSLKKE